MKIIACAFLIFGHLVCLGQQQPVVYHLPGMDNVTVQKGIVFKTIRDTTLSFDIYYPAGFDGKTELPVVIFNNGVGSRELPEWRVYQDWARLVAVNGMIAVNHQSRNGKSLKDSEDLVDYLQQHASALKIDKERFGIWACSANVGVGLPMSMQPNRQYIKALVMYYGAGWRPEDNFIKRQNLEIQVVRAGLDFYNLNKGLAQFLQHALEADAHIEIINYPEGQHAFDIFDNNDRSRDIIQQTLTFLKRKLAKDYPIAEPLVLTNLGLWRMIVEEKKTDAALVEFKKAIVKYRTLNHSPWYNHVIDERNLNQMGYELLQLARIEDAIKVFIANAEAFPDSPNVYDSLGEGFEKSGDKAKAITNSKIALAKLEKAGDLQADRKKAIKDSAEARLSRLSK